jgi:hypothetical protein
MRHGLPQPQTVQGWQGQPDIGRLRAHLLGLGLQPLGHADKVATSRIAPCRSESQLDPLVKCCPKRHLAMNTF